MGLLNLPEKYLITIIIISAVRRTYTAGHRPLGREFAIVDTLVRRVGDHSSELLIQF